MNLIDKIQQVKGKIRKYTIEINKCTGTQAGVTLKRELTHDRDELYCKLGRLVSGSELIICLR